MQSVMVSLSECASQQSPITEEPFQQQAALGQWRSAGWMAI